MRGKYSPTVTLAYMKDQNWWHKYFATKQPTDVDFMSQYDPDGFDRYGYDKNVVDRAGNNENDYIVNDSARFGYEDDWNDAYDDALDAWGFDGVKPVRN